MSNAAPGRAPLSARLLRPVALVAIAASAMSCLQTPHSTIEWVEKRAKLGNGLRLVVLPDATTTLVQVDVRYEVGSNEDPPGKAGLAHLVEHMMFQHRPLGADKPPTFEIIPQISVAFNAYTTYDQTHYWIRSSKKDLESILRVEAFRMASGCETIPREQFDREREVVRNEIRGGNATAEGLIVPLLSADVYPAGHPYSHDTGGDDQQLSNITWDDVCDFMKKYYVPQRAMVIVAGNVAVDEVGKLVSLDFGAIPDRAPAPRVPVAPLTLTAQRFDHELDIEKPTLFVTWKLPPRNSEDWTKVRMLYILAGKLSQQAEDWKFAQDVGAFPLGGQLAPVFTIAMTLNKNEDVDAALEQVWKLSKTASWGLKDLEFDDDAKARSEQYFVEDMEPLDARTGFIADQIQFERTDADFGADGTWLFKELDKIKNTSTAGYASFVKDTLRKDKAVVTFFKAKPSGLKGDKRSNLNYAGNSTKEPEPLVDPSEAKRPLSVPKEKSMLGQAEHYSLGNGMKVVLLPYKGLPLVSAELVFANAGSAVEPASKAGLAEVAAGFLHLPIEADVGRTGISVGGDASTEATTFYASGMSLYTSQIIKTLERTVKIGEYTQEAIESYQRRIKQAFESKQMREQREYQQELYGALFGPDHPFTRSQGATPKSVGNLGYDAAMDFKRSHFTAKNATLIVVGNFDAAEAKKTISANFGDWDGGHQDEPVPPTARERTGPEYIGVVQEKEAPQTQVSIAYPGHAGIDGEEAARRVMTEMLNIRMFQIRTELGSTYGTYAFRTSNLGPNAYIMGGSIDTPRAAESIKAMREKIDALRRGEDFDRDFATARRNVLKKLLAQSTVTGELASRLALISRFGLQPDYYDNLVTMVAAASPAQVKSLIARELRPELEIIVLKADRPALEKTFKDAGLESVRLVDPD